MQDCAYTGLQSGRAVVGETMCRRSGEVKIRSSRPLPGDSRKFPLIPCESQVAHGLDCFNGLMGTTGNVFAEDAAAEFVELQTIQSSQTIERFVQSVVHFRPQIFRSEAHALNRSRKYAASFSMWLTPGSRMKPLAIFSIVRRETPVSSEIEGQVPLASFRERTTYS